MVKSLKKILEIRTSTKNEDYKKSISIVLRDDNGTPVSVYGIVNGFYAYLSQSESTPGLHHTVMFDTVITNVGATYNRHDGIFTAPDTGFTSSTGICTVVTTGT